MHSTKIKIIIIITIIINVYACFSLYPYNLSPLQKPSSADPFNKSQGIAGFATINAINKQVLFSV